MGQIVLKDVECTGDESGDMLNCPHSEWGAIDNCQHYEDVGVLCLPPLVEGDMRLVPEGDNPYEGRLEMYVNVEWGKNQFPTSVQKFAAHMQDTYQVPNH